MRRFAALAVVQLVARKYLSSCSRVSHNRSSSVTGPWEPVPATVLGNSVHADTVDKSESYLDACSDVRSGRVWGMQELGANGKGVRRGPLGICWSTLDPIEVALEAAGNGDSEPCAELSDDGACIDGSRDILCAA